jgi:hypothetical protein
MTGFFYSPFFMISIVCVTSGLAITLATKVKKHSIVCLPQAIWRMFQYIGLALVFYIIDISAGFLVIDTFKLFSHSFVSHYAIADGLLPYVALIQSLVIGSWVSLKRQAGSREASSRADLQAPKKELLRR